MKTRVSIYSWNERIMDITYEIMMMGVLKRKFYVSCVSDDLINLNEVSQFILFLKSSVGNSVTEENLE